MSMKDIENKKEFEFLTSKKFYGIKRIQKHTNSVDNL